MVTRLRHPPVATAPIIVIVHQSPCVALPLDRRTFLRGVPIHSAEVNCWTSTTSTRRIASRRLLLSGPRCLILNATQGGNMSKISKKDRHELLVAVSDRYRIAEKRDKSRILSQFVALTGYHPKHAIRILNRPPTSARVRGAGKSRVYDEQRCCRCVRSTLLGLVRLHQPPSEIDRDVRHPHV